MPAATFVAPEGERGRPFTAARSAFRPASSALVQPRSVLAFEPNVTSAMRWSASGAYFSCTASIKPFTALFMAACRVVLPNGSAMEPD